jgi:NAD(P)-dependent dehydrogenase (short-subunit alcohol dehydrogenase family)
LGLLRTLNKMRLSDTGSGRYRTVSELAEKNINVNNIAPGMIVTPMNQQTMDDPEVLKQQMQIDPDEACRQA